MTVQGVFITGTDTEVGKTWATLALIRSLQKTGIRVNGMKPIASGCEYTGSGLENADARQILTYSSVRSAYEFVNPYAFEPPIAPHIAAEKTGTSIDLNVIKNAYKKIAAECDRVIVEGIGGWRVPISKDATLVDLVNALKLPVILVVGMRLGCINHALLSAECICADGVRLAGWIANRIDPDYSETDKTLEILSTQIPAPLLARFPYMDTLDVENLAELIQADVVQGQWSSHL